MVSLELLQEQREAHSARQRLVFEKVCQIRASETGLQEYRRALAGLVWLDDFLLESQNFLRECIFDGRELRKPKAVGEASAMNGGYSLGFEVPLARQPNFSLYVMDLSERGKQLFQCPECKLVYSLPSEIDVASLLRIKKLPEPFRIKLREAGR